MIYNIRNLFPKEPFSALRTVTSSDFVIRGIASKFYVSARRTTPQTSFLYRKMKKKNKMMEYVKVGSLQSKGCKYVNALRLQWRSMSTNELGNFMEVSSGHNNARDQKDYGKELSRRLKNLNNIDQISPSEAQDMASSFMTAIGDLYLNYFCTHLEQAHQWGEENEEIVKRALPFFRTYGTKLENLLMGTFEGYGEWEIACERRTNIEAFNAMFGNIVKPIDVEDIEHCMQQRKKTESLDKSLIPPNVPKNHWWWW